MTGESTFQGKKVLVQGLGRFGGGVGVSRWLVEQGAEVTVTDVAGAEELAESVARLADLGGRISFKLGGHDVGDFVSCDLLVTNPAVDKAASEPVQAALRAGVAWTTEMNLFVERCRGFTIGVTGSVGKSTTTTLIYEAIRAGIEGNAEFRIQNSELTSLAPRVFLGGNIGKSLLAELPNIRPQDLVVLELSSFMLEDTPMVRWSPNLAVVTNLFANHLDRHHTMAEYAAAKQNILKFQGRGDRVILNDDHEVIRGWAELARGQVVKYTTRGVGALNLVMPGEHNQSNARAALAVLEMIPIPFNREAAVGAIERFGGLKHRLELVHSELVAGGEGGGPGRVVRYYNDSKATSPEASLTALSAFGVGTAIFIVGGYDKHIDLGPFAARLAERAGGVIGIGQTGEAIVAAVRAAAAMGGAGGAGERLAYAGKLEAALPLARQWLAGAGGLEAVVLSPASASWGQFSNYEARGDRFGALARGRG